TPPNAVLYGPSYSGKAASVRPEAESHRNNRGFDACPDGRDGLRPSGESSSPGGPTERGEMAAQTFTGRKRVRKFFGKIQEVAEMPNLIEVQKASYDQFLLVQEPHGGRPSRSLHAAFREV